MSTGGKAKLEQKIGEALGTIGVVQM